MIYFAEIAELNQVKIGFARDPRRRVANMQVHNASKMKLTRVFPGMIETERKFHGYFRSCHIRGEWFDLAKVEEMIAKAGDALLPEIESSFALSATRAEQMLVRYVKPPPRAIPVPEVVEVLPPDALPSEVYLSSLDGETSQETMRSALDVLARFVSGGKLTRTTFPWQALSYEQTQAIRERLIHETSYMPGTVNKFLAALRGVLEKAYRLRLMSREDYDAASDLKPDKRKPLAAGREVKDDELKALFAVCDLSTAIGARDALLLALLRGGGMRAGGVARLRYEEIEDEKLLAHEKGGKDRRIRISPQIAILLARWLEYRGREPGPLLCPVVRGGHVQARGFKNGRSVWEVVKALQERAEIEHMTPHDLRRTFATTLIRGGTDIGKVSKMMGHANVATTMIYDKRLEEEQDEVFEGIVLPLKEEG